MNTLHIDAKKGVAYELTIAMESQMIEGEFLTGETVAVTAYAKDGVSAWGTLIIVDTFSELGSTGVYEITLAAGEMDNDWIIVKCTSNDGRDALVSIRTTTVDIDEIGVGGAGLDALGGMSAGMKAEVNTEVDNGIETYNLQYFSAQADTDNVTNNSQLAKLVSATADWSTFVSAQDSLEALRDHIGNGTNLTEAGGDGDHLTSVGLAAATITSAKFDASTAFPLASVDSGATQVARTGADADTLETLSDQVDATATTTALGTAQTDLDTITGTSGVLVDDDAVTSTSLADSAAQKIRDEILPTQNIAFNNLPFLWVAASDHVTPVTGATGTSVTRSIDGGAFGSATGTLGEIGNGMYQFDASQADMNGGVIIFRFVATGGTPGAPDDKFVTVVTGGGV